MNDMISIKELRIRSKAKLKDAEVLYKKERYDGSVYLCGYAIELILKYRTCKVLKWVAFPETNKEFENYKSFRTHNLDILLTLSGQEQKVKLKHIVDWSNVNQWNPEMRYGTIGIVKQVDAFSMINSAKNLIKVL